MFATNLATNQYKAVLRGVPVTMSSREIAELTGKRHDHVIRDIRSMLDELQKDASDLSHQDAPTLGDQFSEEKDARGYTSCFHLDRELTECLLTGYSATARLKVIRRWHELEDSTAASLPDFTNPIAAARAWADEVEARQLAEQTKALIGNRREATAMATASVAVRKANKLEIELGKSKEYATVKRMQMAYHGVKFDWRVLRAAAAEMDVPAIDVFDANYGTVKAYHADVWTAAYAVEVL